jgi:Tol biopolymer transport system component
MSTHYRSGTEATRWTDPVTGREVHQLTASREERSVHGYYDLPPWSRQTGHIVFSSMVPDAGEGQIYMMERDGRDITYLADSRTMTPNDGAKAQWSADGRYVYFQDREHDQDLVARVNVSTREVRSTPGDLRMIRPTGEQNVYHTHCTRHADEALLRDRDKHGVFVMDLETGESRMIVSVEQCVEMHPRRDEIANWHLFVKHTKWSADGRRLMFVFTNEIHYDGKYAEEPRVKDVYVVNPDGSGLRNVGSFGHHPLWHPNGSEILANCPWEGRPGLSLVLLDADTGRRRLAAGAIAGSGHPSFSPNGRHIAVDHVLANGGHASINLVNAAEDSVTHAVQLRVRDHSHLGTHLHPAWSWDSRQLLFASDASGLAQLCVIDV